VADNLTTTTTLASIPALKNLATYEIATFSGDSNVHIAPTVLGTISGSEGSRSFTETGTANPVPTNVFLGTPALTTVNDAATTAELLAANTARTNTTIYNDSEESLLIKLGGAAGADDYSFPIAPGQLWNMVGHLGGVYRGALHGLWANDGTGKARITDFTAA
jgi:hypothetical protein